MNRSVFVLGILVLCSAGFGQSTEWSKGSYRFAWTAAGFGQDVLGSEDVRRGGTYAIGKAYPEKRFTYKGHEAQIVWSAYYMFTKGAGFENVPVDRMHSYGFNVGARYWNHFWKGGNTFYDMGWGFAYNNKSTRDLDTRLVSTPYFGVGAGFEIGDVPVLAGIRWFHMSNGGTKGNNQGSNQIQYWVGVRF